MKLFEILNEIDAGDLYLAQSARARADKNKYQDRTGMDTRSSLDILKGFWLIDPTSGKKLSGPFKDKDAALSFKANRPDKIPANAVAKPL